MPHLPCDARAGLGRILCAEQEFRAGWEKLRQELSPDGDKEEVAAGSPGQSSRRRQDPQVRDLGYRSASAVVVSIPFCRFVAGNSQFGLFLCGKDPLGYTGGRSQGCAGDLLEHLLWGLIQHRETLLAANLPQ